MKYNVDTILNAMLKNNFTVFKDDNKDYNLNIIGVRNSENISNKFNDTLVVLYRQNKTWIYNEYDVTVDPGTVYRLNPINPSGTAIIMPGQYKGMWCIGLHRGKYKALTQKNPCTVARDNNRDKVLDSLIPPLYTRIDKSIKDGITISKYYNGNEHVFTTETGLFGINCHKAGKGNTIDVSSYSAGCVVFSNSDIFDAVFLPLCEKAANVHGNSFTFTLLLDSEV